MGQGERGGISHLISISNRELDSTMEKQVQSASLCKSVLLVDHTRRNGEAVSVLAHPIISIYLFKDQNIHYPTFKMQNAKMRNSACKVCKCISHFILQTPN